MSDKRLAFFLPNTFTALNMGCGYMAIMFAIHGSFYQACMLIFLGAIFDSVDGRVARMTGTQSQFGEQFDSISDVISFGIAPAFVFYYKFLSEAGRAGMIISFLFLLCGALRLARFNANISRVKSDYFQGLPIPGAALAIVSYVLMSLKFNFFNSLAIAIPYVLIYSILMISSIPFPSFKNADFVRKNKKVIFLGILIILSSLFIYEEVMLPVLMTIYVVVSVAYFFTHREKYHGIFDWQEEDSGI
jgi:CDP-diacylglycerol--serine O-phosphatidyltransferase